MNADYWITQFRSRSIVSYPVFTHKKIRSKEQRSIKHDITAEKNETKGHLSNNSIRRIRYAVNLLEECSPYITVMNERTQTPYQFKLGFLTLTLPCQQGTITDEEIKRKCLIPFLQSLQYRVGKFSYIWKAEAQQNGNIHFHVTLNKYIKHTLIRHYWNKALSKVGFIEEYRRQQQEFHEAGFRARPELFASWPADKQKAAYEFGVQSNWSEPNTIDVHSVRNIHNLSAYLIKYMSKKEEDKRAITGKIWGCSSNLTYNNKFERIDSGLEKDEFRHWSQDFIAIDMNSDFIHCYVRDSEQFKITFKQELQQEYEEFLQSIYSFRGELANSS
jgi:hypothetical protein